jgi:hypothetical protein
MMAEVVLTLSLVDELHVPLLLSHVVAFLHLQLRDFVGAVNVIAM